MRIAATIAGVAAATGLALPGVAAGDQRDSAVGAGTTSGLTGGEQRVAFAAFGGPTAFMPFTGDPVTGHFRAGGDFGAEGTEFQQEGPVTCLVVNGNRAVLVYPNKQARPESNEALDTIIFLEDNGRPSDGESRDMIGFAVAPDIESPTEDPPSEQDTECIAPLDSPAMQPLTRGDFTIRDNP